MSITNGQGQELDRCDRSDVFPLVAMTTIMAMISLVAGFGSAHQTIGVTNGVPIEKLVVRQPDAQFRYRNLAKLSSPCEPL
jgi:hypothetical protein